VVALPGPHLARLNGIAAALMSPGRARAASLRH
jgi:hypothetical protein